MLTAYSALMMKVYAAPNSMVAHHVKSLLDAAGIPSTVRGEGRSHLTGASAFDLSTQPSVWVIQNEDAKRAVEIVEDYEEHPPPADAPPAGAPWRCAGCGEIVEGQFAVCWKCGDERSSEQ